MPWWYRNQKLLIIYKSIPPMNWYLTKLVFSINHQTKNAPTQFDEQLRLVEAKNKLEALIKAKMIGIKDEYTYNDENEIEVTWSFVDVIELREIQALEDGMELHSRIDEHDVIERYSDYVKHRGQLLSTEIQQVSMQVAV
jgi:hypothetical protein